MFSVKFDKYLKQYKYSAKTISSLTGISEATISRYRSGKTVPSVASGNIEAIAKALGELSEGRLEKDEVYEDLLVAAFEDLEMVDYKTYSDKLSHLIETLKINKRKLADEIHISASYLSRICSNQVKPRNPVYIAESVAHYVAYHYDDEVSQRNIQYLIWKNEMRKGGFSTQKEYYRSLRKWILNGNNEKSAIVEELYYQYQEYDKNDFFNYSRDEIDLKIEEISDSREKQPFLGLDGLESAMAIWTETATSSKVNDEIIVYDEIISKVARSDPKVALRCAMEVEKLIKSGKRITVIHQLGIDTSVTIKKVLFWMPLNMSGRVNHYYIAETEEPLYRNILMVASNCVLIGNEIGDDLEHGYYTLLHDPTEIAIARARAEALLKRASGTYEYCTRDELRTQMNELHKTIEPGETICLYLPVPPFLTMSEDLLRRIMERSGTTEMRQKEIMDLYYKERSILEMILKFNPVILFIDCIDKDKWKKEISKIPLNSIDNQVEISYNSEEYDEHIRSLPDYAAGVDNLKLYVEKMEFYKNMNIMFVPERFAAVSQIEQSAFNMITHDNVIIDALLNLLYIVSQTNTGDKELNKKRREMLFFFRNLMV